MGAWQYIRYQIEDILEDIRSSRQRVLYAGRPASASPATGSSHIHQYEQVAILEGAIGGAGQK
jgi:2-oxoglutarate dehydrogenase E1 component